MPLVSGDPQLEPLIRESGPISTLACVNWTPDAPWHLYAQGYLRAARLLFKERPPDRSDLDFLVYPLGMLYRHAIELLLKQVGIQANRALGDNKQFQVTHNVSSLWDRCKGAYCLLYGESEQLRELNRTIAALHRLDPRGMTFRYPTDLEAEMTLPVGIRHVNLANMVDAFERVVDALEAILEAMSHAGDVAAELKGEFMRGVDTD